MASSSAKSGPLRPPSKPGPTRLRPRATVVDLGLRPFDFELIQNAGQRGNLFLVQVEPVREKAQRTPNAPAAAESQSWATGPDSKVVNLADERA